MSYDDDEEDIIEEKSDAGPEISIVTVLIISIALGLIFGLSVGVKSCCTDIKENNPFRVTRW